MGRLRRSLLAAGLQDENQKVKTITALTIAALAEASGEARGRGLMLASLAGPALPASSALADVVTVW
jgi:hypothetical protein